MARRCIQVPKKNLTDAEDLKTMRQDMEREIKLLDKIDHPHVITLKEVRSTQLKEMDVCSRSL